MAIEIWSTFVNLPENIKGAKTKPFFIHCFGRINLVNPTICTSGSNGIDLEVKAV